MLRAKPRSRLKNRFKINVPIHSKAPYPTSANIMPKRQVETVLKMALDLSDDILDNYTSQ